MSHHITPVLTLLAHPADCGCSSVSAVMGRWPGPHHTTSKLPSTLEAATCTAAEPHLSYWPTYISNLHFWLRPAYLPAAWPLPAYLPASWPLPAYLPAPWPLLTPARSCGLMPCMHMCIRASCHLAPTFLPATWPLPAGPVGRRVLSTATACRYYRAQSAEYEAVLEASCQAGAGAVLR